MRKYFVKLCLVACCMMFLSGCTREKEEDGKVELVYGTFYLDESVKEKIREFNEKNTEYNLVVKIYEAADMESMQARLHGDIVSGEGPDIIDLYWLDDYEKYARLGVLEDLTPYLEAQGEDFLKQIYEPYLVDGKACMLIPHFQVGVLFADTRDVGDVDNWKLSAFFNAIEEHAGEKNIFINTYKESLLWTCVWGMQANFIDVETGKVDFCKEEFYRLLEFVDKYGKDIKSGGGTAAMEEVVKSTLFLNMTLSDALTYLSTIRYYDGEGSLLGYPTLEGEVYPINICADAMGISATSDCKEGAWEFLQMFLEEEYQRESKVSGWPVYQSMIEKELYESRELSFMQGGQEVEPLSDGEINLFLNLLNEEDAFSAGKTADYIEKIIREESEVYFGGEMSEEKVAENIQNRIQLVLDER